MPNLYAHQSLAHLIYNNASDEIKKIIDKNKKLYLLGSLASDPLFYYKPLKGMPLYKRASEIHNFNIYDLLLKSKDYDDNMKAYLMGYITHFSLDYHSHKYIYGIEKQGFNHSKIETELEKRIIKLNNKKINKIKFINEIYLSNDFNTKLLFDISNDIYLNSLKDMRFVVGCMYSQNIFKRFIVKLVLKLTGNYKRHNVLMLNKCDDPDYKGVVDECEKIYINSFDNTLKLINNYYDFLTGKDNLLEDFYKTFEGGLYEGKAN